VVTLQKQAQQFMIHEGHVLFDLGQFVGVVFQQVAQLVRVDELFGQVRLWRLERPLW
jgi:hypothetical protein